MDFTKNEQQLLGSTQSEHRDQTASLSVHYVMDRVTKPRLSLFSFLMDVCAVRGLLQKTHISKCWILIYKLNNVPSVKYSTHCDENVWFDAGNLSCH